MKRQKTGGRKKGTKNRNPSQIRQALIEILNSNLDRLQDVIKNMKDEEAGKLLISLAKHLTYSEPSPLSLNEDQLKQVYDYLIKNYNDEQINSIKEN